MNDDQLTAKNKWILLLLLAILIACALFVWWMVVRVDREMRANLLQQAWLVAQAVDVDSVKTLTGTEADINSSYYQRLKEQLAAGRSVNPKCRFVYLMGRKADGTVFFFVDSEVASSKDYSPPGQVYEEVPAGYQRVFDTKAADVVGPVTDRWGVWVSAGVPITDKASGAVVGVLGMDINAKSWRRDIAMRTVLPGGLMLTLLLLGLVYILLRRSYVGIRIHQVALRESEEKYRILVEKANEAINIVQDEVFVFVNPRMSDFLGVPAKDLEGRHFIDFVWPEDRKLVIETHRKRIAGETVHDTYDFRFIGTGGKLNWILLSATTIQWKGKPAMLNLMTDITERKQAEETLQESQRRLTDIIEFLPDATLAIDQEGKAIAWNRAVEVMTGVKKGDMLGKGNYEYAIPFYGTRRPMLINFISVWDKDIEKQYSFIKKEGDTLFTETNVPCVGGKSRILWGKASPLYSGEGKVVGAIESIRDVTERKELEKAIQESEEQFRKMFEASPLGMVMTSIDFHFMRLNTAFCRMLGYTEQELFSLTFKDITHP